MNGPYDIYTDANIPYPAKQCQHEGCTNEGLDCYLPDNDSGEPDEWYCIDHIHRHGYCFGCRQFWAGVENFEFSRDGLCENCRYSGDYDEDDYDPDLDFGWDDPDGPDGDDCLDEEIPLEEIRSNEPDVPRP